MDGGTGGGGRTSAQLEMAGMPRRLFSATPSKLAAFSDCPRRYRFAYVDRPSPPKGPPWAHNTVGSAVHAALRSWWDLPVARRTTGSVRQLLYSAWSQNGFRDAEQSERWRARAAGWLTDYVAGLDPTDEPVGNERTVGATTERLALSGRIDRIDQRGDELVVVDYKTGRHVLSVDDARGSLALAIYALGAARTLRRRCVTVELHHLPSGDVIRWEHTDEALARHLERAEDLAREAAAAEASGLDEAFPPRPGPMCGWCDFAAHCPEGRAACAPHASWAGLAPELEPSVLPEAD
jgi:putative RecB family exonuclease